MSLTAIFLYLQWLSKAVMLALAKMRNAFFKNQGCAVSASVMAVLSFHVMRDTSNLRWQKLTEKH